MKMFEKILAGIKGEDGGLSAISRRQHERRKKDQCVAVIGERMYPLIDWSFGGLQINGDERLFGVDQRMDVTLKFRVNNIIIDVPHQARVVRKSKSRVAFEFLPLTHMVRNKFQAVLDDFMAREFADSQMV